MLVITGTAPVSYASAQTAATEDTGPAAFYAARLRGRRTASGEHLNNRELVAAHPTLPLGSVARVTNLDKGRSVDVRIIDHSRPAARALEFPGAGTARVPVSALSSTPRR